MIYFEGGAQMTDYYCKKCNYRFTLKPGKQLPNRCSYCDSRETFEKVKSAQDIINETLSMPSRK